jgi:tetratricopeptide (TPR) repeat protein
MTTLRRSAIFLLLFLVSTSSFAAKWYEAYEDGVSAAKKKNWGVVVQKMNEAIAAKPNEGDKERSYGAIFVNYKPYYYRGIAHFNLGNFEEAVRDLEKTGGPGDVNVGSVESTLSKAQARLAGPQTTTTPVVVTQTQPTIPTTTSTTRPVNPTVPTVDPAIQANRRQAEAMLARAEREQTTASSREAQVLAAQQFSAGQNLYMQAKERSISADTAADWKAVGDLADRAARTFSLASTTALAAKTKDTTNVNAAADAVLATERNQLRGALENYFNGDFAEAARVFDQLARGSLGKNAMVHAYLGASHYYDFYLGGGTQPEKQEAAARAFRKARQLNAKLTLSSKYFSPRVRKFYDSVK